MADRLFNTLVHRCRQAIRRHDLEEAARLVGRLGESYPSEAASNGLALELLLAEGRVGEAVTLSERLVTRFPGSAGILFQAGMAAFRQKNHDKALAFFEESERLFPAVKSRRWIGKTLTNLGRLDDAESVLINVYREDPHCGVDLAWLCERKGDHHRSMEYVEKHLARFPDDHWAKAQQTRLRGSALDGNELLAQVEMLEALGESVPEALVAGYVEALAAAGRGDDARRFVRDEATRLSPHVSLNLAWSCYRLQLHDLAYDLFVAQLESRLTDVKLLNSLEFAAKRAGKQETLAEIFETLGPKNPALYGRAKKLK